jgi:MoaA/NifB/PqqE/SkfB family radical SAM enzyme
MSWPSAPFTHHIRRELLAFDKPDQKILRNVYFAITKKCPLNCVHCFEGENLNQPGSLAKNEILQILEKLEDYGTMQVQFSGGEPMVRYSDLLDILASKSKSMEYWLITSGHGLTLDKARRLKSSGLEGVCVSIDHYQPEMHNEFRRNPKSFEWAVNAANNVRKANLPLCLNICVTGDMASPNHLMNYARFGKEIGASFILLLEPRQAGNWKDQPVHLSTDEIEVLEDFANRLNYDPEFREYPMITYPGEHQRRLGCFGGAKRFFYIDTDGQAHACPFCNKSSGSLLHQDLDKVLKDMSSCQAFPDVQIDKIRSKATAESLY